MCDRAFMALGTIKEDYQKKVAYYDDKLRRDVLREHEPTGELKETIETGQFQIFLQQVELLKEIGCDMFQGFFFARPMEIEKFEKSFLPRGNA